MNRVAPFRQQPSGVVSAVLRAGASSLLADPHNKYSSVCGSSKRQSASNTTSGTEAASIQHYHNNSCLLSTKLIRVDHALIQTTTKSSSTHWQGSPSTREVPQPHPTSLIGNKYVLVLTQGWRSMRKGLQAQHQPRQKGFTKEQNRRDQRRTVTVTSAASRARPS